MRPVGSKEIVHSNCIGPHLSWKKGSYHTLFIVIAAQRSSKRFGLCTKIGTGNGAFLIMCEVVEFLQDFDDEMGIGVCRLAARHFSRCSWSREMQWCIECFPARLFYWSSRHL